MAEQIKITKRPTATRTDRPSPSNPGAGIDRRTPSGRETRN